MPFYDLFPLRIYKNKIDHCDEIYESLVPHISSWFKNFPGEGENFECTYMYEVEYKGQKILGKHLHTIDLFDNLLANINPMITEYWNELNIVKSLQPKIFEMWMNKNQANSQLSIHNHLPSIVNGIVYLNKNDDHGNIVFENPSTLIASLMPVDFYNDQKISFSIDQEVKVTTGDVIIFPGWLKHKVMQSVANDRVVLAFNCIGEGSHPSTIEN